VVALALGSSAVAAGDRLWSVPSPVLTADTVAKALDRLGAAGTNAGP
jgi:hypothetical protein